MERFDLKNGALRLTEQPGWPYRVETGRVLVFLMPWREKKTGRRFCWRRWALGRWCPPCAGRTTSRAAGSSACPPWRRRPSPAGRPPRGSGKRPRSPSPGRRGSGSWTRGLRRADGGALQHEPGQGGSVLLRLLPGAEGHLPAGHLPGAAAVPQACAGPGGGERQPGVRRGRLPVPAPGASPSPPSTRCGRAAAAGSTCRPWPGSPTSAPGRSAWRNSGTARTSGQSS